VPGPVVLRRGGVPGEVVEVAAGQLAADRVRQAGQLVRRQGARRASSFRSWASVSFDRSRGGGAAGRPSCRTLSVISPRILASTPSAATRADWVPPSVRVASRCSRPITQAPVTSARAARFFRPASRAAATSPFVISRLACCRALAPFAFPPAARYAWVAVAVGSVSRWATKRDCSSVRAIRQPEEQVGVGDHAGQGTGAGRAGRTGAGNARGRPVGAAAAGRGSPVPGRGWSLPRRRAGGRSVAGGQPGGGHAAATSRRNSASTPAGSACGRPQASTTRGSYSPA
jgi:hypothetical protein